MSEAKLVAQVIIDNGDSIAVSNATKDAMVEAMAATERANQKIEKSEEEVARALKTRLSASKEVDLAIRAQVVAGQPLEQELVQLAGLYARLEAAMRHAAKSGGGVPAGLADEAARVRMRMGQVEGQIAQAASRGGASLSILGTSAMGALGALSMLGAGAITVGSAVRTFGDFMTDAIAEAAEAEAVTMRLTKALESQGRNTSETRARILAYSTELSRATTFGDDQVTAIQTQLVMLGKLSDSALPGATRAILDLIAAGESAEAAVDALSKAYNGQTTSLGKMLPAIRDSAKEAKSFEEILKLVNDQVGGQAAAQLDTYEGKVKALGNSWKELKEVVGNELLPVLSDAADGLRIATNFILASGEGEETIFSKAVLDAAPLLGWLRKFKEFRDDLNQDPNSQLLEESREAAENASAQLERMKGKARAGHAGDALAIVEQTKLVEELADAYVSLEETHREKGLGDFKRPPPAKPPKPDGPEITDEQVYALDAKAAQGLSDVLSGLGDLREQETAIRKRYIHEALKELAIEDELQRKIAKQEAIRVRLAESIAREESVTRDTNHARRAELQQIDETINKLEEEKRVRDEATAKEKADQKKLHNESLRLIEEEKQARLQLAETVGSAMGTALGEAVAGEKSAGQAVRQVARETAMAAINAAAAIAAARALAAHAYIPFVGVAIGGAAAAAIVAAIFANKKFLAMAAGGEPRGFGVPGVDSVPIMMRPDENVVDHTTNNRTKKMLDAFERGEFSGGGRGATHVNVGMQSLMPASEAQFARVVKRQLVPVLKQMRESGEL